MSLVLAYLLACAGKPLADAAGEADADSDSDSDTDTDSDADTDPVEMPADPSPFTLDISGAERASLVFDEPTCLQNNGSYRMFWRNAADAHVFVLVAEVLTGFTGAGDYDETMPRVDVKLQEEAGGTGAYYATDTSEGDTLSITVDYVDELRTWGSFTFSSLSGEGGAITATPHPVRIWCPAFQ